MAVNITIYLFKFDISVFTAQLKGIQRSKLDT